MRPSSEPSSLMAIESSSNKTRRNRAHGRAREDTLASLEQRMRKARHKPNPWKCSICCYDFITLEILQNHVKENHHEYTYKCERCPYFSKQGSNMQIHERSHDKMKRKHKNPGVHRCELCNVWLVTLHFSRHLRLITVNKLLIIVITCSLDNTFRDYIARSL